MATNVRPPETRLGTALSVVVPFPSCPKALKPQQYALPLVVSPQALSSPLALSASNASPPDTATGVVAGVVVPFPNSPSALFPQQYATPLDAIAHVLVPTLRVDKFELCIVSTARVTATDCGLFAASPVATETVAV